MVTLSMTSQDLDNKQLHKRDNLIDQERPFMADEYLEKDPI